MELPRLDKMCSLFTMTEFNLIGHPKYQANHSSWKWISNYQVVTAMEPGKPNANGR